jgi:hypothetical protein
MYSSDYSFNGMSRIGNDQDYLDITSLQNTMQANYLLQNNNLGGGMGISNSAMSFALSQPGVNYAGAGMPSNNVDVESHLKISTTQCHPVGHLMLQQRPFLTVPYLGRGSANAIVEHELMMGDRQSNRRSVNKLSERSDQKFITRPLVDTRERERYVSNTGYQTFGVDSRGANRDSTRA